MKAILFLIFAHIITDWSLQPEWMANNKGKYWFVMAAHCLVWTGGLCFALEYFNLFAWWKILFLFAGHYVCDLWKCKAYEKVPFCQQKSYKHMYIDQAWHILQCIVVVMF